MSRWRTIPTTRVQRVPRNRGNTLRRASPRTLGPSEPPLSYVTALPEVVLLRRDTTSSSTSREVSTANALGRRYFKKHFRCCCYCCCGRRPLGCGTSSIVQYDTLQDHPYLEGEPLSCCCCRRRGLAGRLGEYSSMSVVDDMRVSEGIQNWCRYQPSKWCRYQPSKWCRYQPSDDLVLPITPLSLPPFILSHERLPALCVYQ